VPNPVRVDSPADPRTDRSRTRDQPKEATTTFPRFSKRQGGSPDSNEQTVARRTIGGDRRRWLAGLAVGGALAVGFVVLVASPASAASSAAPTLNSVINNLRDWIVGFLAALATLFLTIGGVRYLTAGGDPGQVEKAKTALKSAAIGYALAILAPLLVSILASVVSG
jgi:hypothetical protein